MRRTNFLAFLILLSISLFGATPDPFIGKWKLNWEKSHSSHPRPKSVIRSYRQSGSGVRVQETWASRSKCSAVSLGFIVFSLRREWSAGGAEQ